MTDIFETKLNEVNVGDKFFVTACDTKSRFRDKRNDYIVVKEIVKSILGYTKVKYDILDENFRFHRGCGEMPLTLLTGEECSLGNGRFQYMVSKLN